MRRIALLTTALILAATLTACGSDEPEIDTPGYERLDAIPHARLCITCAKTIEATPRPAPAPAADEEASTR